MICLENKNFLVEISSFGAELKKFENKALKKNFIWNANPIVWNRSSPILFPIIGELKDGYFQHDNQKYLLSKHGFARDRNFEIILKSESHCKFLLKSDVETKKWYPFDFELYVEYFLAENILDIVYTVKNLSVVPMYFSLGAHPAFCFSEDVNSNLRDLELRFENDNFLLVYSLCNGLLKELVRRIDLIDRKLQLSADIFENDVLIMKDLDSKRLQLKHTITGHTIIVDIGDFPNLGLWSKPNSNFICIEPCCGYNDLQSSSNIIKEKEGIIELDPLSETKKAWSITIQI